MLAALITRQSSYRKFWCSRDAPGRSACMTFPTVPCGLVRTSRGVSADRTLRTLRSHAALGAICALVRSASKSTSPGSSDKAAAIVVIVEMPSSVRCVGNGARSLRPRGPRGVGPGDRERRCVIVFHRVMLCALSLLSHNTRLRAHTRTHTLVHTHSPHASLVLAQ